MKNRNSYTIRPPLSPLNNVVSDFFYQPKSNPIPQHCMGGIDWLFLGKLYAQT